MAECKDALDPLSSHYQVAFGLELNTLHDESTPFPHAMSTIIKGLGQSRNPSFKVSAGFSHGTLTLSEPYIIACQAYSKSLGQIRLGNWQVML